MRILTNISRVIVGLLFIFSGLVKANDPLGLAYKMQEFFDVWKSSSFLTGLLSWLNGYAVTFSVIMITLEIVVGIAILSGWGKRFFSWLLLLLMIFFTFLTGYAVFSGKIRTCGCFGDCIPLTAMQSFIKDIILFILVLIIFSGAKYIRPLFRGIWSFLLILFCVALILGLQWHVLRHGPFMDCLPFKKGNNLLELRKMPADAVQDKVDFKFIYQKNGEKKEFSKDQLPDSTWTFVSRKDVVVEAGKNNIPKINDLFLTTSSGNDTTEAILGQPGNYYLFLVKDIKKDTAEWVSNFRMLYSYAAQKNIPLVIVASQASAARQFVNDNRFNVTVLACDATALKTAARTNPSLYLMKGPVVMNKWGRADIDDAIKK